MPLRSFPSHLHLLLLLVVTFRLILGFLGGLDLVGRCLRDHAFFIEIVVTVLAEEAGAIEILLLLALLDLAFELGGHGLVDDGLVEGLAVDGHAHDFHLIGKASVSTCDTLADAVEAASLRRCAQATNTKRIRTDLAGALVPLLTLIEILILNTVVHLHVHFVQESRIVAQLLAVLLTHHVLLKQLVRYRRSSRRQHLVGLPAHDPVLLVANHRALLGHALGHIIKNHA